jgi:hypothetical protein
MKDLVSGSLAICYSITLEDKFYFAVKNLFYYKKRRKYISLIQSILNKVSDFESEDNKFKYSRA